MIKFLSLILIFISIQTAESAYWHHDEGAYLSNYDAIVQDSFAEVDHTSFSILETQCRGGSFPENTVSITSPSVLQASDVVENNYCGSSDICIIESGVTLHMNTNLIVGALIIRGKLEWNDDLMFPETEIALCGGYIVVEQNGIFSLNVQNNKAWIYLRNNGAVHSGLQTRVFGSDATVPNNNNAENHPLVDVRGRSLERTWTLLSKPPTLSNDSNQQLQLELLHNAKEMNWQIGDRIAIAPMERLAQGWGHAFRIANFQDNGNTIVVDSHESLPSSSYDYFSPHGIQAPEVINLSRNVIITGDDLELLSCQPDLPEAVIGEDTSVQGCRCAGFRTKCTVGLHTIQKGPGIQKIHNTRIEKCGQRGIEGKYCLHFHKVGECPECSFQNNAIEYSHQRGIIVHGSHLTNVQNNVLYNVRGSGIYIEDGNELYNKILYNVVLCPYPFLDGTYHGCTIPGTSNRLADTKDNQSAFFARSIANDFIGNRNSNAFNGMFIKAGGFGRGSIYGQVCESAAALGRYEGNTFHSNGRFGTYTLGSNYPKTTDQSVSTNGFNIDQSLCQGFLSNGDTHGLPGSFAHHTDYGNAFVGHYEAGDMQYNGHFSVDNNNLLYWKETKNFDNGCAAHVTNSFYAKGTMALPDHATFLIEHTTFGDDVLIETNHHCNVGNTGLLCMPTYMLHKVAWKNSNTNKSWVQFVNNGGIFTLSPEDAALVLNGGTLEDSFFPPGFVSLVSNKFQHLLDLPDNLCQVGGALYHFGIICKVPLRALRVYANVATSQQLKLELWWKNNNTPTPTAVEWIDFHRTGSSLKMGYAVPVIPGEEHSYKISLNGAPLPDEWVIEFSDPVVGNRWSIEYLRLIVAGRSCPDNGLISSQHDRKYIWSGDEYLPEEAWGNHGACVGSGNQPIDEATIQCDDAQQNKYGSNDAVFATECPEKCIGNQQPCDSAKSYCDCGSATCLCKPGFVGANCEIDLCQDCIHGLCAAQYLGGEIGVRSIEEACICEPGWTGIHCDMNDVVTPPTAPSSPSSTPPTSHCGCKSCSGQVWNLNADGHSCGSRIQWLQSNGYANDELEACRQVSQEFPSICGPDCHPDQCNDDTNPPTPAPSDVVTPPPTPPPLQSYRCGCKSCSDQVWNLNADGHSCGSRIQWLQSNGNVNDELEACRQVSQEFPSICGPDCHPDQCNDDDGNPPTNPPGLPSSPCEGICLGSYPFECAELVDGAAKYGCYPGGGCYYANSLNEPYPYDDHLWCTFKVKENNNLLRRRVL